MWGGRLNPGVRAGWQTLMGERRTHEMRGTARRGGLVTTCIGEVDFITTIEWTYGKGKEGQARVGERNEGTEWRISDP